MARRYLMSDEQHAQVSAAVAAAEARSAGEIVTILAERSDSYDDIALAWSALIALLALTALAIAPDFYLGIYDRLAGSWTQQWHPRGIFTLALFVAAVKFAATWLLQLWQPLKFVLIPGPVKHTRVRHRAISSFRIGAERRTQGRTGILLYLSMRERRAEIVADEAIAARVDAEVWGEAMHAMLAHIRDGRIADGMCAAIERVGALLAEHFPRADDDRNELPDRLIEV
jgi:putative membrane protein